MGSPLSPATWLRWARSVPDSAAGSPGYLRMFGGGLLLALGGMFLGMLSIENGVGRIDAALPWLLLAAVRWMAPRELSDAMAGDPTPRLRTVFALTAAVVAQVPFVIDQIDGGMFRLAQFSDNPPQNLSTMVTSVLWVAVPLFALGFGLLPRRLLAVAARPMLVAAMVLGAPLVLGAAVRHLDHPSPNGYIARLISVPVPHASASTRDQVIAMPVGRCTIWSRAGSVSLEAPDAGGRPTRWLYPGFQQSPRIDRRRNVLYVPDVWSPRALDLADCHVFTPTLRRLVHDLAPPMSWTLAAVVGFAAAAATLRRARAFRRAFGEPSAWREATRTSDGELVLEGSEARLRANGTDPAYAGPVVLLRSVVGATSHYRDVTALGPGDYVEGDRAAVLRAIAAARSVADAEALAYVVVTCVPLAACASLGLLGRPWV